MREELLERLDASGGRAKPDHEARSRLMPGWIAVARDVGIDFAHQRSPHAARRFHRHLAGARPAAYQSSLQRACGCPPV